MSTTINFKLKDQKPDKDFIKWNELMSKNFDQNFYYEHSHPVIVWVEKTRLKIISNLIKQHIDKTSIIDPTIVEVGCGVGHVLQEIEKKVKTKNLIGIDPLDSWLLKAQEKLNGRVKLIKGIAEDLPFENESVDFVVCSEVLEHVIDPHVVLKELKRIVKSTGLIIVSIPNEKLINRLKNFIDLFKIYTKLFPNIQKHNDWHLHCLDLASFKEYIPKDIKIQTLLTIPNIFLPLRYVITFSLI